jgi:hypothetical protein
METPRHQVPTRVSRLGEHGREEDLESADPAECLKMVWPITLDAWAFTGERCAESRLPRHLVHIQRAGR